MSCKAEAINFAVANCRIHKAAMSFCSCGEIPYQQLKNQLEFRGLNNGPRLTELWTTIIDKDRNNKVDIGEFLVVMYMWGSRKLGSYRALFQQNLKVYLCGGALSAVHVQCARSATIWVPGRSRNPYFVVLWASLLFGIRF